MLFRVKTRAGGAVAAALDGFRKGGEAFAELLDREAGLELSARGFSPIVEARRRADLLLADYQNTDNTVVFRVRFIGTPRAQAMPGGPGRDQVSAIGSRAATRNAPADSTSTPLGAWRVPGSRAFAPRRLSRPGL